MKILIRLIDKVVIWYKQKRDQYDREEMRPLIDLEAEFDDIPAVNKALSSKKLTRTLRQNGQVYHDASMRYLAANPDKSFADFDILPTDQKEQFFNA